MFRVEGKMIGLVGWRTAFIFGHGQLGKGLLVMAYDVKRQIAMT